MIEMKLIKEITPLKEASVDGEALYFNPVIYDYAKKNDIPLYELLRCLQDEGECLDYFKPYGDDPIRAWTQPLIDKWFSSNGNRFSLVAFSERGERYDNYLYRELLVMDIFGLTANDAENYQNTGAGMPDEVLFKTLSKLSENKIKSPLDMREVRLWDGEFIRDNRITHIFRYDSDEEGMWHISPYIFGYAKSFERRHPFINYNELPRRSK